MISAKHRQLTINNSQLSMNVSPFFVQSIYMIPSFGQTYVSRRCQTYSVKSHTLQHLRIVRNKSKCWLNRLL